MRWIGLLVSICVGCGFELRAAQVDDAPSDGGNDTTVADAAPIGCFVDLDAHRFFTCAARTDGTAWCWGDNQDGQLGDNTFTSRSTPVRVGTLTGIVQVATASRMAYALDVNGIMWGWGLNDVGQLGDGSMTSHGDPRAVPGLTNVTEISAGRGHVCARTLTGDVLCWGYNSDQQVGNGQVGTNRTTPFVAATGATDLSANGRHTCAVIGGSISCWGDNLLGELGRGTTTGDEGPGVIPNFTAVVEVVVGGRHTCARRGDGTVWCWGDNRYGQSGAPNATTMVTSPAQVPGVTGAIEIFAAGRRSCARVASGEVWCWGERIFGYSGTNQNTIGNEPPHVVPELTGAGAIGLAAYHVCAVLADQELQCIGRNSHGQLGDGTQQSRTSYKPTALACP